MLSLLGSLWKKYTAQFKYPITYRCRYCLSSNLSHRVVHDKSNNNVGRPYCVCVNPKCDNTKISNTDHHYEAWVSWRDDRDIKEGNPLCLCERTTREDHTGAQSNYPGQLFWTCSTGSCRYKEWVPRSYS